MKYVVPGQDPDSMYKLYEICPYPWPFHKILTNYGWVLDIEAWRKNETVQRQFRAIEKLGLQPIAQTERAMNIEQMSDRKLAQEKHQLTEWIHYCSDEEVESGEADSWRRELDAVRAVIKRRHEQGKETR
jgi:hypothetical protein